MQHTLKAVLISAFLLGGPATVTAQESTDTHDERLLISPLDWFKDRSRVNPHNAFSVCSRQYGFAENKILACEYGVIAFCKSKPDDRIGECAKVCEDGLSTGDMKICHYGCFAAKEYGGCTEDS